MPVATQDMRVMSDEELLEAWQADEASPALAEIKRRDALDKRLRAGKAIRDEWEEAAYQQYRMADAACCGELLSKAGKAAVTDEFSLWRHSTADAMRFASPELLEFWETSPRVTVREYMQRRAVAMRAAREDTATEEASYGDRVDAHGRGGLDADAPVGLRRGRAAGAVRDAGHEAVTETSTGTETAGSVQPERAGRQRVGGEAMDTAPIVAGGGDANPRQSVAPRREVTGTVVRRPAGQAPVRSGGKLIDGAWLADLADAWIGGHCYLADSARHAIALWDMAQHFRTPGENPVMVWPKFPHVLLVAETPGSGKTTVMKVSGYLCQPYFMGIDNNPTAPGLCLSISQENAALFIDEAHRLIGARGQRKADVVTIMCASFEQDATYPNARGGKINRVPVYTPMMIAAKKDPFLTSAGEEIGDVIQRSHLILMSKPPEGTELTPVDGKTREDGRKLAEVMAAWAAQQMADKPRFEAAIATARDAADEIGLELRDADVWLAQFTVAALCSPGHLQAACDAALELRRNQPAPKEEDDTDPLADLEASLAGGGKIASWG